MTCSYEFSRHQQNAANRDPHVLVIRPAICAHLSYAIQQRPPILRLGFLASAESGERAPNKPQGERI